MTNDECIKILEERFITHMYRHENIEWVDVVARLNEDALSSLIKMEETGGEPDVVAFDEGAYIFVDCVQETPVERRNTTYDLKGEEARNKKGIFPKGNVMSMALAMGIELLDESMYRYLQSVEEVDLKTSSWIKTPDSIHDLGGAIFGDRRYNHVFIYHNGAQSFYSSRGFRGMLKV